MNHLWVLASLSGLTAAGAVSADEAGMLQSHALQQISVTPAGPCNGAAGTSMARLKFSTLVPTSVGEAADRRSVRGTGIT
jgi:hypothetical protein